MAESNPQECGNVAWAFATLRRRDRPLFDAIAAPALSKMAQFSPQNLANTAWAWAALCFDHAPLRAALSSAAMQRLELFGTHELASTAWSFATVADADAPLLHCIATEALVKICQFAPQAIGNIFWSFSTLSYYHEPLLDGIVYAARARTHLFKSQELANTVWSLAVFRVQDYPLLEAIAVAAICSIRRFRQQELANTAWAFAKLLFPHLPLLDAIAAAAAPSILDWGPQELANTAWAFARLRALDAPLLQAIPSAFLARLAERQPGSSRVLPRHVEMVTWALSRQSDLAPAWTFLDGLEGAGWRVGSQAVAGLLGECERRGLPQRQRQLLHLLARSAALAAPARAGAVALPRPPAGCLGPGGAPGSPFGVLRGACLGGPLGPLPPSVARGLLAQPPGTGREHEKEARLLAFVLSTAPPGRPEAICEAIEPSGTATCPARTGARAAGPPPRASG
ncbi:unnamed protein product [Prorocentrum cordatum]|uniref:RNA-editing substrate-binding complex 6 protein domain-containing protein n=1 Tax=Prorocentrum cordatum TaxID=2364126 RepID=A0ABN9SKV6_9DINO|nr:unnamed protein product [Polarella glacialis]